MPDSVIHLGPQVFTYCESLTLVVLSRSISQIHGFTFYGCSSLTSIVIPDGVLRIGVDAFADCPNLKSVFLPKSLTRTDEGRSTAAQVSPQLRFPTASLT